MLSYQEARKLQALEEKIEALELRAGQDGSVLGEIWTELMKINERLRELEPAKSRRKPRKQVSEHLTGNDLPARQVVNDFAALSNEGQIMGQALGKAAPQIGERWRVGDCVIEIQAHDGDAVIGQVVGGDAGICKRTRISDLEFRLGTVKRVSDDG